MSANQKPVLFIMVRAPMAGRAKTRLAAKIGVAEAIRFYRAMSRSLAIRLGNDPRWETIIAVTPDEEVDNLSWPAHLPRIPQRIGNLGDRMQRLLDLGRGRRAMVIGSDIPGIRPNHIAHAISALGQKSAVFGPAPDGGYWLVGSRGTPRVQDFFSGIRWSSQHTLADTVARLGAENVTLIDYLEDVDEAAEYQVWKALAGRVIR